MKILVACEFSGIVAKAFRDKGHYAYSCDLLPTEGEDLWHYQGDVRDLLGMKNMWDMMIAFPPCTHLAVSGAKHFAKKRADGRQQEGIDFFMLFANSKIPKVCVENPVGIMSTQWRKPDQIIQPWQFGRGETKPTCLWLKNLPKLQPTDVVEGREHLVHRMAPGPNRKKDRSRTYQGIADAMADQWGTSQNNDSATKEIVR